MSVVPDTVQQLIEECQGLVRSLAIAARRNLPQSVELDDLVAYGQVGLVEAARNFDPSRGNRFSTYAYYRIRGAIYDGMAKMSWFGRGTQNQLQADRLSNEVLSAEAEEDASAPRGKRDSQQTESDRELGWLRHVTRALAVVHLATQRGQRSGGRRDRTGGRIRQRGPDRRDSTRDLGNPPRIDRRAPRPSRRAGAGNVFRGPDAPRSGATPGHEQVVGPAASTPKPCNCWLNRCGCTGFPHNRIGKFPSL